MYKHITPNTIYYLSYEYERLRCSSLIVSIILWSPAAILCFTSTVLLYIIMPPSLLFTVTIYDDTRGAILGGSGLYNALLYASSNGWTDRVNRLLTLGYSLNYVLEQFENIHQAEYVTTNKPKMLCIRFRAVLTTRHARITTIFPAGNNMI